MNHRVNDTKVPAKVRKLMREEEARDFNGLACQLTQNGIRLRAMYTNLLEEQLDNLGHREHWGKTLEWKMVYFKVEAREILKHWAKVNNIPYATLKRNGFFDVYEDLYTTFMGILATL